MKNFTTRLIACFVFGSGMASAQYCMLPGRTYYGSLQPGIKNFKLNTINRTSGAVELPLSSPPVITTTDSTTLQRGKTYTVTIQHTRDSVSFPTARNHVRVWIDYNNDKDFDDAGETAITSDFQTYGTFTGTFTVPLTAPLGTTKLRATAKMSQDAGHTIPTSCDMPADPIGYHGEMEDYKVTIIPATGINEIKSNPLNVSVFPNPATNIVSITMDNFDRNTVNIDLYYVTGKLIANVLKAAAPAEKYSFDLSKYTATEGIYFIKATSGEYTSYQKLVKIN